VWFRKQERQQPVRDAVKEVRKNVLYRRIFEHGVLPLIDAIDDPDEHEAELERAWSEFRRLLL
jgi:hypothetical protein